MILRLAIIGLFLLNSIQVNAVESNIESKNAANKKQEIFSQIAATITYQGNNKNIYMADFQEAVYEKIRKTFYHGHPPEGKEEAVKKEVWETILTNTLLLLKAEAEKINVDREPINNELTEYDKKYSKNEQWEKIKKQYLSVLERRLLRKNTAEVMKNKYFETINPSKQDVKDFYEKNPQLFTEPERIKASILLIGVDPSSPKNIWELAFKRLQDIRKEIKTDVDFSRAAKQFSTDVSADNGGDMGFLHQGQIGGRAKIAVESLQVGAISDPVYLLEGVALFMVTKKISPTHHKFNDVKKRAKQLTVREQQKKGWDNYLKELKANSTIITQLKFDDNKTI